MHIKQKNEIKMISSKLEKEYDHIKRKTVSNARRMIKWLIEIENETAECI